jgi:hypothetical protein
MQNADQRMLEKCWTVKRMTERLDVLVPVLETLLTELKESFLFPNRESRSSRVSGGPPALNGEYHTGTHCAHVFTEGSLTFSLQMHSIGVVLTVKRHDVRTFWGVEVNDVLQYVLYSL